ncbi:MAG: hypothetical protein JWR38_1671 [Mucilaginibacter sp.]|nr:hypothetical protein [Mucilaginibacter sp.]
MLNHFARINEQHGNIKLAIKYQQEAKSILNTLHDQLAAADASASLGILEGKQGHFNRGIQLIIEAYNEIYRRYFYLTYTHDYKKLRDKEQAKNVVQDVFTSLWFKRETNLPNSSLGGYLYTAVCYKIFDLFAHQEVESKYVESLKDYLSTHSSAPTDHLIREKQLQAYIEKEIDALPPKMKQIFLLSRKENLSHQEIATQLDISTNNVSKQVMTPSGY